MSELLSGYPPEINSKPDTLVGQALSDRTITRLLDQGSHTDVYLAEDTTGRLSAVKILRDEATFTHPSDYEREKYAVEQEISLTMGLTHPHIIGVEAYGIINGRPYTCMPYIEGGKMTASFPRGTKVPLERVSVIVSQIGSALQYIHDRGIVHRDLKPENILLSRSDAYLCDFGISRSIANQTPENGEGPSSFIAPEQILKTSLPESDQYALAGNIYHWITGELPFPGETREEKMQKHLMADPVPFSEYEENLAISRDIETVILRGLAKNPSDRYPSVAAFAAAFEEAVHA